MMCWDNGLNLSKVVPFFCTNKRPVREGLGQGVESNCGCPKKSVNGLCDKERIETK